MNVVTPVVAGQDPTEQLLQVGLRAGAKLHQRQPGGGVGDEHVTQTIAQRATKGGDLVSEVDQTASGGINSQFDGAHFNFLVRSSASPLSCRALPVVYQSRRQQGQFRAKTPKRWFGADQADHTIESRWTTRARAQTHQSAYSDCPFEWTLGVRRAWPHTLIW
jgi:hypothetical protein